MKRAGNLLGLICLVFICSGCNADDVERKVDTVSHPFTIETIYGCWEATDIAGFGPVSSMSPNETESIIGDLFCYDENRFSFDSLGCDSPSYSIRVITDIDGHLWNGYRVTSRNLGITDSILIEVRISNCKLGFNESYHHTRPLTVFILNEGRLLIPIEADFFYFSRVPKEEE